MAQTVPSAGFSPLPDYGSYSVADIDFALLQDCEVPSPSNFSALYYETTSPTMFNSPHESSNLCELKPAYKVSLDDKPYSTPSNHSLRPPKKEFKTVKEELEDLEASLNGFMQYHPTPSPMASPSSPYEPPRGLSIKQEYSEPDVVDDQLVLGENQLLREPVLNAEYRVNSPVDNKGTLRRLLTQAPLLKEADHFDGLEDSGFLSSTEFPADVSYADLFGFSDGSIPNIKQEYTMLRKCLGDQSYIQKYNHNPQEVCQLADMAVKQEDDRNSFSSLSSDKIDPVLNMALEQVSAEIDGVCSSLGVSPDPSHWSVDDVKKWLLWASQQYNLQEVNIDFFSFDGATLSSLTENDFRQRAPLAGDLLYACVDLWRTTHQQRSVAATCSDTLNTQETSFSPEESLLDIGEYIGHWDGTNSQASDPNVNSPPESSGEPLSEEEEESTSSGRGGSHIHLWQFLKELLSNSQQHSSCIRWVDRQNGVFKIEDSVQVAKLWGKRKNRPAMNYDKLSRSIRQYYKKGIMKKTERSQRLVYQFCHPYSL